MPANSGLTEVLIVLFGAKRIPELSQSIGSGIREFKKEINRRKI
ncbi:hypothetical protein MROS_1072 [Melioribacter roseus P3M-2]|uniref:Sec-independent protein translocase protein TatA n=1 Tax=Melioribacter roseus (strain DSM 23840 / JCM 17771 / VKM B-2668 / P3M-2) TaxID=1191523 RepID=I7A2Z8_MELRP|nr:twin-arginine translocase TatA/TatE family subunit [Melioribacter roseus]AFN74311.1 hypothetical protein MROS_1072 [Melioribacter roseus P3M-2]